MQGCSGTLVSQIFVVIRRQMEHRCCCLPCVREGPLATIFGSARNRSTSQPATDASSTDLHATAATPHEDNHDKRTPEDIEQQMQHSEGAALHAAISAGKEASTTGKKSNQEVAAVIESAGGDICGREHGWALVLSCLLMRSSSGHEWNAMALPKRRPTHSICAQATERQRR